MRRSFERAAECAGGLAAEQAGKRAAVRVVEQAIELAAPRRVLGQTADGSAEWSARRSGLRGRVRYRVHGVYQPPWARLPGRAARGWRGDGVGLAVMVPLGFQVGVLPAAALVYVGGYGVAGNQSVLALCAVLMVATAALAFGVVHGLSVRAVLVADVALGVVANLVVSAWSLTSSDRAIEVPWQYYAGCVALATVTRGVPGGLVVVAGGIALRVATFGLAGVAGLGSGLGDALVLVLAMGLAAGVLALLDRDAERLRVGIRRSLHDTVLQTLEAIALTLPNDEEQASSRLREVRAIAHAEAVALRRELSRRGATSAPDLVEGLIGLVAELARDGLRVRLDATESADFRHDGLTAKRRAALIAATREALRNVLKHSGTAQALVRVEATECGLTLTIRDFGVGFDPNAHQPGFGLSESVAARMREAGGAAAIGASPGRGTSVTLWVPVEGSA